MSQCWYTPLNFSCSLLLKLPKLEDNSEYFNFLVFLILLFHFLQNHFWNELLHQWKDVGSKRGSPPLQNYEEINFFLKLRPCSWLNQSQSQIKKIINNYFCIWTSLNLHEKLLLIFKFKLLMKGSIGH